MGDRRVIDTEDKLLVERLRAGDSEAWTDFIARYRRLIWSAINRVRSRYGAAWDDAAMDDLFEDAIFRLLRDDGRALNAWKGRCKLETWIYRIVRNVCIDHLRKDSRRSRIDELREDGSGPPQAGRGGGASEDVLDLRLSIEQAMADALSPRETLAVRLIYFQGFTYREVAERFGMTVGALSGYVYRALGKLRDSGRLERDWSKR